MNREEIVEILKEHFPTKGEFSALGKEMRDGFDKVNDRLDDLKASSNAVDKMLEVHPIERIERLERHDHLPKYVHAAEEE